MNTEKEWSILINELKFNPPLEDYSEKNIEMQIIFSSAFIQGSNLFRKKIDKIFFSELIKKELCTVETLEEDIALKKYYVYSCENNKKMKEKIKTFPSLNFEIKENNLTFIFNYLDLFKSYNDRLFFMIIYEIEKYSSYVPRWIMGDIFLRKYITTYNFDAKAFIFYRNQVNEMNIQSQINYKSNITKINFSKYFRMSIEIIMGLIIVIVLYLFYRKYESKRKIHANELEDSNYVYESRENKNSILSNKNRELNKIFI